jgi:hypothetical protein
LNDKRLVPPFDRRSGAFLCYARPEKFRMKRIFATIAGVFLRGCDTISPAKNVLVAPASG